MDYLMTRLQTISISYRTKGQRAVIAEVEGQYCTRLLEIRPSLTWIVRAYKTNEQSK